MRKIEVVPDEATAAREYSLPRGVHVNVQDGDRVPARARMLPSYHVGLCRPMSCTSDGTFCALPCDLHASSVLPVAGSDFKSP